MQRLDDTMGAIRVAVGETFALALTGNPTTGYTWHLDVDPHHLKVLDQSFDLKGERVGAGGQEVFHFCALAPGEGEITCEYRRPWDQEALDTKRFRVTID